MKLRQIEAEQRAAVLHYLTISERKGLTGQTDEAGASCSQPASTAKSSTRRRGPGRCAR
jgi:hypothetical protein